jgi:capsule polysaccharide export protein KpsE/RkpR
MGSEFLGQIQAIAGFGAQVPTNEIYLAILQSDRVGRAVIDSLGLVAHYEVEADTREEELEQTLVKLRRKTRFETPDMVSVHILATDGSPAMAADVVNAYLEELEIANQTLALSRARRTRQLVQQSLRETAAELDSTWEQMQRFQEEFGVFAIEKQTEGTLELIGALQTELLAAQTQRDALGGYASESAAQVRNLELRIAALRSQISQLVGEVDSDAPEEVRRIATGGGKRSPESYFLPLTDMPSLARRYARLAMGLKVQEAKYNVLATQLEQTRIEESQSLPAFDVLDRASVPQKKSGPQRKLYVLAALVSGILSGILVAVLLNDLSARVDATTRREFLSLIPGFPGGRAEGGSSRGER